jgi:uncharacterized repeat protein (TIGR01451 family)
MSSPPASPATGIMRMLLMLTILLCGRHSLKAGAVGWTLNATFGDGGTATGVFTFDSDTGVFSNWNVSTSGGNTSVFFPFDFTPANSSLSFNATPNGSQLTFVSNASFPVSYSPPNENLVLAITSASPLSDAGGTVNITPGSTTVFSYECFDCSPSRVIAGGAVIGHPAPDLTLTITDSGNSTFTPGQGGAMYTIAVSNVGSAATSGTVTVTDSLPIGLTATNIAGAGWTCLLSSLTCSRADSLAASASYPVITVAVSVAVGAPGGVTNAGSVSGGGETNLTNDTAGDYTTTFTPSQVAQAWSYLNPPVSLDAALLMTDATIMAHQFCSSNWYRLAPDNFGNYATGTWSQTAPMQGGYAPFAFSSAVLADGRLVVLGGEYNLACTSGATAAETDLGSVYDPTTNTWTPLSPPSGWSHIGDASNVVLPDGRLLLASVFGTQNAVLDPMTLTWTSLNAGPPPEEAGWTLLPDGSVLMPAVSTAPESYRYLSQTDTWVSAGDTVAALVTGNEIGPQVLRPDGTVFVAGATGHTAIYDVAAGKWAAGPDFPGSGAGQLVSSDVPASILPNGNVLVQAFNSASLFSFEFDGTHLNPVPGPYGCMALLLLPTGQVSCSGVFLYNPTGSPDPTWAPTIATAPNLVQPGLTYVITGTQFNGLSQAAGFGDDYQGATNYPLVRIVNTATGHVVYCRTQHHSTMGVATGAAMVSTQFNCPASIEKGPSTLVVIANGIPSHPWPLTVSSGQSQYQLTISASPATGGIVTPASGAYYDPGTVVPITAAANSGYAFAGWSGSVANANSTSSSVTMNAAQAVVANFTSSGSGHTAFFAGEDFLGGSIYYLQFQDTNLFGYYGYLSSSILYHQDMGYEAFIPSTGGQIYFYDFAAGHWWYTSASLFPYLYDFTLNTWVYYFPDTTHPGHYTAKPRSFVNLGTGTTFSM